MRAHTNATAMGAACTSTASLTVIRNAVPRRLSRDRGSNTRKVLQWNGRRKDPAMTKSDICVECTATAVLSPSGS